MLNSMRSSELIVKINLNNKNGVASDSGVNFANQSESLASIKELDVVPEKLDSLAEQQQQQQISREENNLTKEKLNQNPNSATDCIMNTSQENENSQNVRHFFKLSLTL